jgi:hypothetical protein
VLATESLPGGGKALTARVIAVVGLAKLVEGLSPQVLDRLVTEGASAVPVARLSFVCDGIEAFLGHAGVSPAVVPVDVSRVIGVPITVVPETGSIRLGVFHPVDLLKGYLPGAAVDLALVMDAEPGAKTYCTSTGTGIRSLHDRTALLAPGVTLSERYMSLATVIATVKRRSKQVLLLNALAVGCLTGVIGTAF